MQQYKGANWTKLEPHIFATAEMARRLVEETRPLRLSTPPPPPLWTI